MTYIELPTWLLVVIIVSLVLLILYIVVGDLIAKVLYKHLKDKGDKDERNNNHDR